MLLRGGGADTSPHLVADPAESNTVTGSDLVKGGEIPVLLASDALGRIGLLRYPADFPETPIIPVVEPASGENSVRALESGEEGNDHMCPDTGNFIWINEEREVGASNTGEVKVK